LTAHITRPGSPSFRQLYDQTAFGTRRTWQVKDMIDLAIEAGAPDEDILAFPHASSLKSSRNWPNATRGRETEPNLSAALTVESIEGAKQDIAVAQFMADPSIPAVQKVYDRTLRLERRERGLLRACRAVLASRGLRHLTLNAGSAKQW
jgi:hypothetical protein